MYRKGRIKFPGSVERPGFGDKFCTNAQVRLRTQLKLDANSVKRKRRILIISIKIQKILQDKNNFDQKRGAESKEDKIVSTNFYEDRKFVFISDNTKYVSLSVKNSWANSFLSLFRNV